VKGAQFPRSGETDIPGRILVKSVHESLGGDISGDPDELANGRFPQLGLRVARDHVENCVVPGSTHVPSIFWTGRGESTPETSNLTSKANLVANFLEKQEIDSRSEAETAEGHVRDKVRDKESTY
jgi:hypothetical protein